MIARGDLYWVDLGTAVGSRPAKRRPVLVVQADEYNASRIATVIVAVITSNLALEGWPERLLVLPHIRSFPGTPPSTQLRSSHSTRKT